MATALPVNSQLRFKRQTAKGVLAGATQGQILRRETAVFPIVKEIYDTASEIADHQQLSSVRHGAKTVNGKITNILSPGTYSDMIGAVMRRDFAVITPTTADLTIAGTGPTFTVTRAAGSFLTDGYKIGIVVRLGGALGAANIGKNLLITDVTATVLTVLVVNGVVLTTVAAAVVGATVTAVGKVTFAPATGHTNVFYTVETWDPDVPSSERNLDVKISQVDLSLPGSGNAKINITAVGLDQSSATTAYFTTPTAATTTGVLVGASGLLVVNGVPIATVTDLSITINGKETPAEPSVGSTVRADIFRSILMITGSFTAYFDTRTLADNFLNEVGASIVGVLPADSSAAADFIAYAMPIVVSTSSDPDDGIGKGKKRTYGFIAKYNAAGGVGVATQQTTLQIQDSAA